MQHAQQMMDLYAGLPRAYGTYKVDDPTAKGKKKGQALTVQEPVTVELWKSHLNGDMQLGIVPIRDDASCAFGVIDIDVYDLDHAALEKKIDKLKFPLIIVRSKSGGAHLSAFFKNEPSAKRVREVLCEWAASLGYAGVEVFPKQNKLHGINDTGNWINMPYSGGDKSDRVALHKGERMTIEQFLILAERKRIDLAKVELAEDEVPEALEGAPPCLVTLSAGIPEGGRNNALFNYGLYCKKRWPDDWPGRLKEINDTILQPPLPEAELNQIVKHVGTKDYTYTCKNAPINAVCRRDKCITRKYGIGPSDAEMFFGIELKNVLRIDMDPAVYFADFKDARITFSAAQIASQTRFREATINQANSSFGLMTGVRWQQFVDRTLGNAERVQAPPETRGDTEIAAWLEDYCTEQIAATDWTDVIDGQVLEENKRMYFRPHKWAARVSREHRQRLTLQVAYTALLPLIPEIRSEVREIEGKQYKIWSVPSFARREQPKKKDGM